MVLIGGLCARCGMPTPIQAIGCCVAGRSGPQASAAQVRLALLKTLPGLSGVLLLEHLAEAVLPAVDELAADRSWRVRHELVALTPPLASALGVAFAEAEVVRRALGWLTDAAAIIRAGAAAALCDMCREFGRKWARDVVVTKVRAVTSQVDA